MRRLAAAALSALIPGLGQLFNGRRRLAALFLIPSLILLALGALIVGSQSGARLAAWIVSPQVSGSSTAWSQKNGRSSWTGESVRRPAGQRSAPGARVSSAGVGSAIPPSRPGKAVGSRG